MGVFLAFSAPAHAADAEAIISEWFADLRAAGADVASYGAVEVDPSGDGVTVHDLSVRLRFALEVPGKAPVGVTITAYSDATTYHGLERTAQGYRARSVTAADGLTYSVLADTAEGAIDIEASVDGLEQSNTEWPRLSLPAIDGQNGLAEAFAVIRSALAMKNDRLEISKITLRQSTPDGGSQTTEMFDIRQTGMAGGKIASNEVGRTESTQTMPMPQSGKTARVTNHTGRQSVRDIDLLAMLDRLDPATAGALAGQEPAVIIGAASTEDTRISGEGLEISVDRLAAERLTMGASAVSATRLFDRLLRGETVDEETMLRALLDYIGSFGVARIEVRDVDSAAANGAFKLRRMEISDASSAGVRSFVLEGLSANSGDGAEVGVQRFALGDLQFPPFEALARLKDVKAEEDIAAVLAALPRLGRIEMGDVTIRDGRPGGVVSLDHLEILQKTYINTIPTDIRARIAGLLVPARIADDPEAVALFEAIGLSEIRLDQNIALRWDVASEDLELERSEIRLENGGRASLRLRLGGLPRAVIEDPNKAQLALATLTVKDAEILVEDAVGLARFIEVQAREAAISPELMRAGLAEAMLEDLGPLAGTAFAAELKAALVAFMADPGRLSISVKPKAPVPLLQAVGLAATAPEVLVETLGVTISAN